MKLTVKVPPGAKPGKTKMNVPYGNGQVCDDIPHDYMMDDVQDT